MKLRRILTVTYLIMLCTLLPLYMQSGYYKLGEAKGLVFMALSGAFFIALVIVLLVKKNKLSPGVFGVLIFTNIVTFLFAVDKKTALLGLEGWRMGLVTILLMIFFACLLSEGIDLNGYIVAAILITSFIISIITILERFGINIIPVASDDTSFVATVGNINWLTGFLAVFVPMGVGIATTRKRFSPLFFASEVYVIAGLMALLVQGSDSALLVIIGTYAFLWWLSLRDRDAFKSYLIQIFTLGIAMVAVHVLMLFAGDRYNYSGNMLITLCKTHTGIILMAAMLFIYRLSRFFEEVNLEWKKDLYRRGMLILTAIGIAAGLLVFFGIYTDFFGNGRGIIWRISGDMYSQLTPFRKIVGVGQDCYYSYAYSTPEWSESFLNVFEGYRLTNAHNIYLTTLIENGVMGLLGLLFVFGYTLTELVKASEKKKHAAIICALPIVSYLVNGLVSFSQILSASYVFMILGYALFVTRDDAGDIKQDQVSE